ncbi:carbohydrate esterase family 4 protein [Mycena galericulata]|nr:carbohydrate esterase family 4 protein [Mycena galericulata]
MFHKACKLLPAAFLLASTVIARPTDAPPPKANVIQSCIEPNTIALTFDDGPWKYETKISDLLTKYGAKGTFFVNGYNYDCIYTETVAANLTYTFNAGHQICSHTWSHPDLTTLNASEISQQFSLNDDALERILGIKTEFLRPPYGNYNDLVRQVAGTFNKTLVVWDWDSGDSVGESWEDTESDYDKFLAASPRIPNLLPLNHETEQNTSAYVMPYVIPKLQAAGYRLVTLAECLGTNTWKCHNAQ